MQPAYRMLILRAGAASAAAVMAALCLRYLYLDHDGMRVFCDAHPAETGCRLRAQLGMVLRLPMLGWGVLAFALLAALRPNAGLVMLASALAGAGMVLYQADLASGSAALLLLGLAMRREARQT